jgi:hypothetical protein
VAAAKQTLAGLQDDAQAAADAVASKKAEIIQAEADLASLQADAKVAADGRGEEHRDRRRAG